LLALRLSDGAIVWSAQFTADDVWSMGGTQKFDQDVGAPPNLFVSAGRALVGVGDKGGSYRAFDRDTGKLVWMKQLTAGSHLGGVMGASAYANGSLYVASNHGVSGWLTDKPRAQADVEHAYPTSATVFALNADDGTIRWQSDITPGAAGGVTIANGVVYVPTTDGVLDAFASDDGRLLTTRKFGDSAGGGITVSGGMVFAGWGWDWTKGHPGGFVAYGLP
jgi:outer membrane protein assembly factor BamB